MSISASVVPKKRVSERLLAVEIPSDCSSQLAPSLSSHVDQVLEIVACCETHLSNKVPGSGLDVAIITILESCYIILRTTKVGVAGD
jgi:hypothetical protein